VQTTYRLLRTWDCIEPYVQAEREYRKSQNSFLNSYEMFAAKVKRTDIDAATERLYRRGRRRRRTPRMPISPARFRWRDRVVRPRGAVSPGSGAAG
jgi:hypothetical protein